MGRRSGKGWGGGQVREGRRSGKGWGGGQVRDGEEVR